MTMNPGPNELKLSMLSKMNYGLCAVNNGIPTATVTSNTMSMFLDHGCNKTDRCMHKTELSKDTCSDKDQFFLRLKSDVKMGNCVAAGSESTMTGEQCKVKATTFGQSSLNKTCGFECIGTDGKFQTDCDMTALDDLLQISTTSPTPAPIAKTTTPAPIAKTTVAPAMSSTYDGTTWRTPLIIIGIMAFWKIF